MPKAEFLVFADGYNILHSWEPLSKCIEDDLDIARSNLTEMLAEYHSLTKNRVVLVFDAHKVRGCAQREEQYKGIQIVYTKPFETADLYIERRLLEAPPRYRVMVVSNDSMIQQIILGRGGIRVTVQEFMTALEDQKQTLRRKRMRLNTVNNQNIVSLEEIIRKKSPVALNAAKEKIGKKDPGTDL